MQAQIKGTDADKDLAVLAVQLSDIKEETLNQISIASLGSSDDLTVGEPVIAIGNALGYGQSVTTGVVSALNRPIAVTSQELSLIHIFTGKTCTEETCTAQPGCTQLFTEENIIP